MKIETHTQGSKIKISLMPKPSMAELIEWKSFIISALMLVKGKNASLVTVDSQSNSFGFELGNYQNLKRKKKDYLINWDITLNEDVIKLIVESEEFERGLLFLVFSQDLKDIFDTIDAIDIVGSIDFSNLIVKIIVLEDDGKTLTCNYLTKEMEPSINRFLKPNC